MGGSHPHCYAEVASTLAAHADELDIAPFEDQARSVGEGDSRPIAPMGVIVTPESRR